MVDIARVDQVRTGLVERGDARVAHGGFQFVAHDYCHVRWLWGEILDTIHGGKKSYSLSIRCSTPSWP